MNLVRFSLFISFLLAAQQVFAQVTFTAKASQKVVGQSDLLEVEFVLNGVSEVDQFTPPQFGPFEVAQGPSYTSGFNLINGNASSYYSVSFYLRPGATGKFTIAPASVRVNGRLVQSNAMNVEVVKGSTGAGAAPPSNPFQGMMGSAMPVDPFASSREAYGDQMLRRGENAEEKIRKNMILRMNINKNSCYVGEPVVATCKLYSRLESESKVAERPSFSGFSVVEMAQPQQSSVNRETLGGRPYNSYLIRKAQLYPLRSGDLSIEPIELDNSVTLYRPAKAAHAQPSAGGSVFDQMMRDFWGEEGTGAIPEKHTLNLTTDPITIRVKPLPEEGKPADFTGAVGQFTLQSSLANTNPRANETDTLVLILRGSGNLPLINAPALHFPKGIETYDPSARDQVDPTVSPIKGSKTFSYTFTVDREGNYTLPPVTFSYFDPQSARYKTLTSEPLLMQVLPGKRGNPKNAPPAGQSHPYMQWVALALGLLVAGSIAVVVLKKKPKAVPPPVPEESYAPQVLAAMTTFKEKDWFEDAHDCLKENNSTSYFKALNTGIWGLLSDRLDLGGERNKDMVLEKMEQRGFSPYVREEVRTLLEECELALYAPVHTGHDMQRVMEVAERVRKRFEHDLRD